MRIAWQSLTAQERSTLPVVMIFLNGRLSKRETIQWALSLDSFDKVSRLALLELLEQEQGRKLKEPWRTAWRFLEEFWATSGVENQPVYNEILIKKRLKSGEKTGALVAEIVQLFRPYLSIEALTSHDEGSLNLPRRIRSINDLFRIRLRSHKVVNPIEMGFDAIDDSAFANSLVIGLDTAIASGLEIARRCGWSEESAFWRIGPLYRVYYVPVDDRGNGESEPDEFHEGVAPSVKLLHAATVRLIELDQVAALVNCLKWKTSSSRIYQRLWAALARDERVASASEVFEVLSACSAEQFWSADTYPEYAELRSRRFSGMSIAEQEIVCNRIMKLPPRSLLKKYPNAALIAAFRKDRAIQEFARIESAGSELPEKAKKWLNKTKAFEIQNNNEIAIDHGFLKSPKAFWIDSKPDERFNQYRGEERLNRLEQALKSRRDRFDEDPVRSARAWINHEKNTVLLLADFEGTSPEKRSFPSVWDAFGWKHVPALYEDSQASVEAARVVRLILGLPLETVNAAIDGITNWFSNWSRVIVREPDGMKLWMHLWPLAEQATNSRAPETGSADLSETAYTSEKYEKADEEKNLDTLNSPVGKLISAFLDACPNLELISNPFVEGTALRLMRNQAIGAEGMARLTAMSRMIESIDYFLKADTQWTEQNLIAPLSSDGFNSIQLWRAIGRRTRFSNVLRHIGDLMAEKATDRRLGRDTQKSLSASLAAEALSAYMNNRDPVIAGDRITQTLRTIDDEIRAHVASVITLFSKEVAKEKKTNVTKVEEVFDRAVKPFLERIWPQERSLSTPSISKELAHLPAAMGERFAEAVNSIERFLVPFNCWSLVDFGLFGEDNGQLRVARINTRPKAAALLKILDACIGVGEGAIVPYDLAEALTQVKKIAPDLQKSKELRRLATLSRRV